MQVVGESGEWDGNGMGQVVCLVVNGMMGESWGLDLSVSVFCVAGLGPQETFLTPCGEGWRFQVQQGPVWVPWFMRGLNRF